MTRTTCLYRSLLLVCFCCAALGRASADSLTLAGSFAADNSTFDYTLTTTAMQDFTFYTTSYGGGLNANGTTTSAGGFVPVLTLFSPTGTVIDFGGAGGTCGGASNADPSTGLCNDAKFSDVLAPGTYNLVLSEFPNVPVGKLSDGFLFSADPTATGDVCGVSGGTFLEADVAPCVQRRSNYAVNVSSPSAVPEPATWLLVLPAAAAFFVYGRRQLA
jgi:hypothetical protein